MSCKILLLLFCSVCVSVTCVVLQLMCEVGEVDREMQEKQQESAQAQRKQGELEAAHIAHKRELAWRNTTMADLVQEFSLSGKSKNFFGLLMYKGVAKIKCQHTYKTSCLSSHLCLYTRPTQLL